MVVRSVRPGRLRRQPAAAARGQPLAEHHNTPDETASATPARHSRDGLKRRTASDRVLGCALQLHSQPLSSISPHPGAPGRKNLGSFHRWQPPGHPGRSGPVATHVSRSRCAALPTSMRPFWMHNTLLQARLPQPSCISHQTVTPNPTETRLLCCLSAWVVAPQPYQPVACSALLPTTPTDHSGPVFR